MKGHYKHFPAIDLHTPLTAHEQSMVNHVGGKAEAPINRPEYHTDECNCESCCDIRAAMDVYLRQRELFSQNGFI